MASRTTNGVALITGAASGIGKDTGFSFAESGALCVIFADRNESAAQEAAEASKKYATNPNYTAMHVHVEVADVESVRKVVDAALSQHGRIDYFVHSAGIGAKSTTPMAAASLDEFDSLIDVNLRGTLICNQAVLKAMSSQESHNFEGRNGSRDIGKGCIVNVGSMASLVPIPGVVPYCASKHGVSAVTKTAAAESGRAGIRVNMVCPSWVKTPMLAGDRALNSRLGEIVKAVVPSGRMAEPDEVADTIVFLCSPAASYISGHAIYIDNGVSLTVRLG